MKFQFRSYVHLLSIDTRKLLFKKGMSGPAKHGVRNSCNLNNMYKMSSLLKVIVMKVNTLHVNGRFTVASGWHKINNVTFAFQSEKHVNLFVSYYPFIKYNYFLPWDNPCIGVDKTI